MPKVLVIEDDNMIRGLVVDILHEEGFSTVEACHGAEALEVVNAQAFDLILCDIMMPNIDGFQVLDALRSHPQLQTTPFIFLTAKAERQDWRHGMEHGADDYITKPFSRQELLNAVSMQLRKQSIITAAPAAPQAKPLCPSQGQSPTDQLSHLANYLQTHRFALTADDLTAIAQHLQAIVQQLSEREGDRPPQN